MIDCLLKRKIRRIVKASLAHTAGEKSIQTHIKEVSRSCFDFGFLSIGIPLNSTCPQNPPKGGLRMERPLIKFTITSDGILKSLERI
jgi:hypothetical protein